MSDLQDITLLWKICYESRRTRRALRL